MTSVQQLYNRRTWFYHTLMDRIRARSTTEAFERVLPRRLPPHSRILDLGSGSGLVTRLVVHRYPEAQVHALDYAEDMLAVLKRRLPHVEVITADFNASPTLSGAPYQLIVSAGAVSEYADWSVVLPWIQTLLAPGGMFVNVGVNDGFMGRLTGRLWQFEPRAAAEFVTACQTAGFRSVTERKPSKSLLLRHLHEYIVIAEN